MVGGAWGFGRERTADPYIARGLVRFVSWTDRCTFVEALQVFSSAPLCLHPKHRSRPGVLDNPGAGSPGLRGAQLPDALCLRSERRSTHWGAQNMTRFEVSSQQDPIAPLPLVIFNLNLCVLQPSQVAG